METNQSISQNRQLETESQEFGFHESNRKWSEFYIYNFTFPMVSSQFLVELFHKNIISWDPSRLLEKETLREIFREYIT